MKQTEITLIKLTATDGHYLTNGDACSKEVYLGINDSPENWHEVTEEEYHQKLAEEEARMEAEVLADKLTEDECDAVSGDSA